MADMKLQNNELIKATPLMGAVIKNQAEISRLLYLAGSELYLKELWELDQVPKMLYEDEFCDWLKTVTGQPRPLLLATKLKIRSLLSQPFWINVDCLPLPKSVKYSLGLTDN
jgi:hypothetical protein